MDAKLQTIDVDSKAFSPLKHPSLTSFNEDLLRNFRDQLKQNGENVKRAQETRKIRTVLEIQKEAFNMPTGGDRLAKVKSLNKIMTSTNDPERKQAAKMLLLVETQNLIAQGKRRNRVCVQHWLHH